MKGNGFKLEEGRFRQAGRHTIFTGRVLRHWDGLPIEGVGATSLQTPEVRLSGALGTHWSCGCPFSLWGVDWMAFKSPFQP